MQKAQKKRNQSCLAHFGGVCPKFLNFFSTAHFAPKIRKSVRFSFKTLDLDLPISSWLFFLKFLISFYFVFLFIDFKTSILLESALLNSIGQPLVRLKKERKQRQQQYKLHVSHCQSTLSSVPHKMAEWMQIFSAPCLT